MCAQRNKCSVQGLQEYGTPIPHKGGIICRKQICYSGHSILNKSQSKQCLTPTNEATKVLVSKGEHPICISVPRIYKWKKNHANENA